MSGFIEKVDGGVDDVGVVSRVLVGFSGVELAWSF